LKRMCSRGTATGLSAVEAGRQADWELIETREAALSSRVQDNGAVFRASGQQKPYEGCELAAGCWDLDPRGLKQRGRIQMLSPYIIYYRPMVCILQESIKRIMWISTYNCNDRFLWQEKD
jgi:hypothetical protein